MSHIEVFVFSLPFESTSLHWRCFFELAQSERKRIGPARLPVAARSIIALRTIVDAGSGQREVVGRTGAGSLVNMEQRRLYQRTGGEPEDHDRWAESGVPARTARDRIMRVALSLAMRAQRAVLGEAQP